MKTQATFHKVCPACKKPFTVDWHRRQQILCSIRCKNRYVSRFQKGKPMDPRVYLTIRQRMKTRVEDATRELFGELTPREVAIFNRGVRVGYYRACNRGRKRTDRSEAA